VTRVVFLDGVVTLAAVVNYTGYKFFIILGRIGLVRIKIARTTAVAIGA